MRKRSRGERSGRGERRDAAAALAAVLLGALLVLAVAGVAACDSGEPEASPSPSGLIEYSNDDLGFSISRDATFETEYSYEAPLARFKIGFLDVDTAPDDRAPDTLLVTGIGEKDTQRLATPEGREELIAEVVDEMAAAGQGKKGDWEQLTVNGLPAAWRESWDKRSKTHLITCLVIGSRDIYVLTGDASRETWDEKLPLYEQAFTTFREL